MSSLLDSCIHENQGAFIPGRQISDNVLVAYKVLHMLKNKKGGRMGNFTLKLDMSKAYDRIEWNFLAGMMVRLGFHLSWVTLVMRCIALVTYTVGINGGSSDSFEPSRGLRQGNPLSSYLFLICVEGLSIIFVDAQQHSLIKGVSMGRGNMFVIHLLFVDDSIIFGKATIERAINIRRVLSIYEQAFGQLVNYEKSFIYFGANVVDNMKNSARNILKVRVATNLENYLRLPMIIGRNKKRAVTHYLDHIRQKMGSWLTRFLLMRGEGNAY